MNIISSELLHSTGVVTCGISTRHGGVSPEPFGMNMSLHVGDSAENVHKNRELFVSELAIGIDQLAVPKQVHSSIVKHVHSPGNYPACDGLVTDTPQVYLCISVADCVPIFILDTQRKAIAAIHAGWRGTTARIAERGVEMLVREFQCRPEQMVAFIGPAASVCCYDVGEDVAARFSEESVRHEGGKTFVDLKAANVSQLVGTGMLSERIEVSPYCTVGEVELFHSYRRDRGQSGRMMGVIGLKA